jgi:hypothetical protein
MSERLVFELQAVDRATAPIQNVQNKLSSLDGQLKRSTQQVRNLADESAMANVKFQKWTRGSLQQAGYQIGDFAVQVANGTSKMQAFGQQAPQLLQVFGPAGAVIGAVVSIFAAFAVVAEKTAKAAKGAKVEVLSLSEALGKVKSNAETTGASIDIYLTRRFGEAAESVKDLLLQIDKYNVGRLQDALRTDLSGPMKNVFGLTQTYSEMTLELDRVKASIDSINNTPIDQRMGGSNETLRILNEEAARLTKELSDLENKAGVTVSDVSKLNQLLQNIYKAESQNEIQNAFIELNNLVTQIGDTGLPGLSDALIPFAEKIGFTSSEINSLAEDIDGRLSRALAGEDAVMGQIVGKSQASLDLEAKRAMIHEGRLIRIFNAEDTVMGLMVEKSAALLAVDEQRAALAYSMATMKYKLQGLDEEAVMSMPVAVDETSFKRVQKTLDDAKKSTQKVAEVIKYEFESIRDTISNSMEDAFMSMVDGTKKPIEAFKSMASAIIKELFRVLVVQRMVGSFGGGGILGGLGTIFPGLNATIPARATGGTVSGGRPYMVGERGPELMVPGRTGTVVPNDQLSGGGVTVNQTINISTGVAQTVRSEIRALMPQIADNAKAAVLDAKRRGGAYGGAFA